MKMYWFLVRRNYDGKLLVMAGSTNPNSDRGLTGLYELTDNGFRFETPFGYVKNASSYSYNPEFYSIVKKVEATKPIEDVTIIA